MHALTQHSGRPKQGNAPQESIKSLIKDLMESALRTVADGAPAPGVRKAKISNKRADMVSVVDFSQEMLDTISGLVAKVLADVGNRQVALQRAELAAVLTALNVIVIQSGDRRAPLAQAVDDDDTELTTEEAAQMLHVSRPYVVKLLDTNMLPLAHVTIGGRRRIRKVDVLGYKALLRSRQELAMKALASSTDEASRYEARPAKSSSGKR